MERVQIDFVFQGRVQGVGFRYTVAQVAVRYEVKGWVRNLADGTVGLRVQGRVADIDKFVDDIQRTVAAATYGEISGVQRGATGPIVESESGFRIRRD